MHSLWRPETKQLIVAFPVATNPRRSPTTKAPTRAERVVGAVLDATLEELGRVGFAALSVEEVARLAGVNKTTVYRRWPTKPELVQASFERFGGTIPAIDTGSLRGDLTTFIGAKLKLARTPRGRALMRTLMAEAMAPDLIAISRKLRVQEVELYRGIFAKARARKELRKNVDVELLMSVVEGPFTYLFLSEGRLPTDADARRVIDLVLSGVASR
jgi:AcrR family transcriptional regulator